MEMYAVYGPPGTGKTTSLSRRIRQAVGDFGAKKVVVCSFTRAAAYEIGSRDIGVDRSNIGTVHSLCFRALGRPNLVNGKEQDFNKDCPQYTLAVRNIDTADPIESSKGREFGELLRNAYDINRSKMLDRKKWRPEVISFAGVWESWKKANDLFDFNDLLEKSLTDIDLAPNDPVIGFVDESQDISKLSMAVILKWGQKMQQLFLCGDDDQLLYEWSGVDPEVFLNLPIPDNQKFVLSQSWRIPKAVHDVATRWIGWLSKRQTKEYRPRDEMGFVTSISATWKQPEYVLKDMDIYLKHGKKVMILASCAYLLEPMKKALMNAGIPFHNPYRQVRGDWNPLMPGTEKRCMPVDRVLSFIKRDIRIRNRDISLMKGGVQDFSEDDPVIKQLHCPDYWTWNEVFEWGSILQAAGVWRRGGKTWLDEKKGDCSPCNPGELSSWLTPEAIDSIDGFDFNKPEKTSEALRWWMSRLVTDMVSKVYFPVRVVERFGPCGLLEEPKVIIGTIHSVKGGEADIVYLIPNLSTSGLKTWYRDRDPIIRMFYVGFTRAREGLIFLENDQTVDDMFNIFKRGRN